MNREILFRYTCVRDNGYVFNAIFTLEEIEDGTTMGWMRANITCNGKLYRQSFTGYKDKKGKKIF